MSRLARGVLASLLAAALLSSACADSNEELRPADDSGSPPPSIGDAAPDATLDAGDAAPLPDRICTADDWCHTDVPTKQKLLDVWGDGKGGVWTVSDEGSVLRLDDEGWKIQFTTTGRLTAVWGSGSTDLWAGGASGLFHGDGATWTAATLGDGAEAVEINDIAGSSATGIWAVGKNASSQPRAFHRAPSGTAWERVQIGPLEAHERASDFFEMRRVFVTESGDVWMTASALIEGWGYDYLFRLPAGAASWSLVPWPLEFSGRETYDHQFSGVGAVDRDVWLFGTTIALGPNYWIGKTDGIVESRDWKIARWRHPLDGEKDKIRRFAVWGLSANDLWTSGSSGRLQHWDGTSWTTASLALGKVPIGDDLVALWGRSNDDLWVVGGRRALHKVSKDEAARLEALHAERARKDGAP